MGKRRKLRPFTGDEKTQIRLLNPPVRLVLCQIAWPELVDLPVDMEETAKQFGQAIADYPVFEEHFQSNILLTPSGASEGDQEKIYQWKSADGEWCVVLGRRFLSFYRTAYTSFEDFSAPLESVLAQLQKIVNISVLDRVGLRHVNQISDPDVVEKLKDYLPPEVLGYSGAPFATDAAQLEASQNQVVVSVNQAVLQARSGILPAMQTVDPAIPPHQMRTWILDLDSTVSRQKPFVVEETIGTVGELADINYDFFKLVATEGLVKKLGGE